MTSPAWRRRFLVLFFVIVAVALGSVAKEQLGISFTVDGLQTFRRWVEGLGWSGPVVFVLLVVFRLFIGLSSHLILILGGLAFGVTGGMIWGSLGLLVSSIVLFYLARHLGTDWVQRRFGHQSVAMLERIQRLGSVAIFAVTAHPLGLLTPAHLAAGLVRLDARHFFIAVALAAPVRTAPYVFLGIAVLDLTVAQSLSIGGLMLAVFILPLFSPKVRSWLWASSDTQSKR